jgi:hypothetical protein
MFENRMLSMSRMFGPKREEVAGGWRRPHDDELHNFYTSLNVTGVMKSRTIRWVGHLASMRVIISAYKILLENLKERDNVDVLGINGKLILEWILGK